MADAEHKATSRRQTRQPYLPDDGRPAVILFVDWVLRRCFLLQEAVDRDIKFPRDEDGWDQVEDLTARNIPCRVERLLTFWYPRNGSDSLRDLRFESLNEIREPHLFGVFHSHLESLWKLYEGFTENAAGFLNLPFGFRRSQLGTFDLGLIGPVLDTANAVIDQAGLLPRTHGKPVASGSPLLPEDGNAPTGADPFLSQTPPTVANETQRRKLLPQDIPILVAMSSLEVSSVETCFSSTRIAEEMQPPRTRDKIKDGLTRLREGDYVTSIQQGNQGGYQLTAKGRKKLPNAKAKRKLQ